MLRSSLSAISSSVGGIATASGGKSHERRPELRWTVRVDGQTIRTHRPLRTSRAAVLDMAAIA